MARAVWRAVSVGVIVGGLFTVLPVRAGGEAGKADECVARGLEAYRRGDLYEAVRQWQQALQMFRKMKGTEAKQADCLRKLAVVYGKLGQPRRWLKLTQQALEMFRKIPGTERHQAGCLLNLGAACGSLGQYRRCIELTQQALKMYREMPGTEKEQGICLVNLGAAYRGLGDYQRLIELTQQALDIFRTMQGSERSQAMCLLNLGVAYGSLGQARRLIELTRQALEIYRTIAGTQREQASCLRNLGVAYWNLHDPKRSISLTQQALEMYRKVPGTQRDQADCLQNLGVAYGELGQQRRRIELTQQALEMYKKISGTEKEQGDCLINLGSAHRETGEYSASLEDFSRASRIYRHLTTQAAGKGSRWIPEGMYKAEAGMGKTYWRRGKEGDLYRAYRHYARAIRIIEYLRARAATSVELKASYFARMVWVYDDMIRLLLEMKQKGLEPNEKLMQENDRQFWMGMGLEVPKLWAGWRSLEEAMVYYNEGQHARVLRDLMASGPIAAADEKVRTLWRRFTQLVAQQDGVAQRLARAEIIGDETLAQELRKTFADVSRQREQAELELSRTAFGKVAKPRPIPLKRIQSLIAPDEAIVEYKVFPDKTLILVITKQGVKLYTVKTRSAGEQKVTELLSRRHEVIAGQKLLERLRELRQRKTHEQKPPEGMLAVLSPDELIKQFTVAELVWLYRYPMQLMAENKQQQAWGFSAQHIAISQALYKLLLAPIEADLKAADISALIVVPDGPLYYLPLAGLVAKAPEDVEAQAMAGQVYACDGVEFVLERWRISYLPSVSMYAGMLEATKDKPQPAGRICAFADPVFSRYDARAKGSGGIQLAKLEVRARGDEDMNAFAHYMRSLEKDEQPIRAMLSRLPNTAKEARRALQAFGGGVEYHRPDEVRWDRKQNLALVDLAPIEPYAYRRDLSDYGYVLFSTHGVIRPDDAMRSYVALTSPDALGIGKEKQTAELDGRLTLGEAFGLQLNARMVTLSACETAGGDYKYGEGIIGLTAALFVSGSRGLTASVWRVDDEATGELVGRYHELMASGIGPAEALRKAQLELLIRARKSYTTDPTSHTTSLSHPFFWSPFLLLGQWK